MKLEYITPGMGDPRGKPKVYLSCHPDDFDPSVNLLAQDILRHAACAVWYDAEPAAPWDEEELLACLGGVQLMAFAVTSRFLRQPNRARDVELRFALRRHIPILPILLEAGLERAFNETCAEVQLVNRYVSDPTATPYEEVLDTFLKSVLIGDETARKVRDAFDAYVFLSYRKKDRRHAQRLMHLIHENPQFRDIAVWYDEYLVPGEDFNDAIRVAFDKSGLFALAVTPNLLEPDNYVMQVEYPLALARRENEKNLEIVPVEMYEPARGDARTDQVALRHSYDRMPELEDEHDRPRLDKALADALGRIARKENDGSAQHRFFIGLAYLSGIDVEVDCARALSLITSAAEDEKPCFDATAKLVDMYTMGEGVARSVKTAVQWQKKLVAQYRAEYEKGHSPDEHLGLGTKTFRALMKLSDLQRELGDLKTAAASAREALNLGGGLVEEVGAREVERDMAVVCNRLGALYRTLGEPDTAADFHARAMGICSRLAAEMGTARARRDLSICQERVGDMHRLRKEDDRAEAFYSKAYGIRRELAGNGVNPAARRDLSAILTKLGDVRKAQHDYEGAATRYAEAMELDRVLAEEQKNEQAWDDYAVSLAKLGDIRRTQCEYHEALELHLKAVEIFSRNAEKTGSLRYRRNLASGLEKLAKSWNACGGRESAETCFREAIALREGLLADSPTHSTRHELATTCFLCADFNRDADMMRRALRLWDELCAERPEYRKYADSARRMLSKLM